jgi:hypothetical protein
LNIQSKNYKPESAPGKANGKGWKMNITKDTRFVCNGGYVISKDEDRHFICASRVAILHGLNPKKCILVNYERDLEKLRGWDEDNIVYLYPCSDGDYINLGGLDGSK